MQTIHTNNRVIIPAKFNACIYGTQGVGLQMPNTEHYLNILSCALGAYTIATKQVVIITTLNSFKSKGISYLMLYVKNEEQQTFIHDYINTYKNN